MNTRTIVTCLGTLIMLAGMAAAQAGAEIVDRIVAVVNKTAITEYQIQQAQQRFAQEGAPEDPLARESVLDFLIEQELILQQADTLGIPVTDAEIADALENIKAQNNLPTDEALKSALAREGKTLTDFTAEVREQIQLAKIVGQEVRSKIDVTDAEVDAYYAEHRDEFSSAVPGDNGIVVRQILLAIPETADPAQIDQIQRQADALVRQLRAGADFADLAREYSDHSSADAGGNLGVFQPGDLVAPFDAAFSLKPGEVTDPIRSDQGVHIITAQPADTSGQGDLLRIKSQIRNMLFEEKSQAQYDEWVATLKDQAYIEIP